MERDGLILDREPRYFTEHSADELTALGFNDIQLSGIRECLAKRKLYLKGESERFTHSARPVAPALDSTKR